MNRSIMISGLLAVIVAIGGYAYLGQDQGQLQQPLLAASAQEAGAEEAEATDAEETAAPEIIEMEQGDPDAPITVIEYASHTCPHCASFHTQVYPQLIENYVETGQVRFIMREVYADRYGLWAGMVARCGGPLRYFGIVEMIMEGQRDWVAGSPGEVAANLRRLGLTAGLSDDQLDACLTDNDMAQALVAASVAAADEAGISGTPSFVINGELYPNMGYAEFSGILDSLLEE